MKIWKFIPSNERNNSEYMQKKKKKVKKVAVMKMFLEG